MDGPDIKLVQHPDFVLYRLLFGYRIDSPSVSLGMSDTILFLIIRPDIN